MANDNDLLNQALDKGGHVERLVDMWALSYGSGCFEDYMTLHANPLQSAEYPLGRSAPARRSGADAAGLTDFCSNAEERFGSTFETSWTAAATLDEALVQPFAAAGTTEGLDAAKAAIGSASSDFAPVLAEYLSAVAYAQTLNQEAIAGVDPEIYVNLTAFRYCPPATSDGAMLETYVMHGKTDLDKLRASGLVVIQATEALIGAAQTLSSMTADGSALTVDTPFGAIILGTVGEDTYADPNAIVLLDPGGNDIYDAQVSCQGTGHYGFAALVDISGDDSYNAIAYAQASAGNKAMAFLVDADGNDTYYVEPYATEGFENVTYSQYPVANGNWSQGCGVGNRSMTSSLFSTGLSGGIAGLIDLKGNDTYTGGDDVHKLQKTEGLEDDCGEGASIGFVWDRGIGTLINDGGNDSYSGYRTYCGVAWSAYDAKGPETQDQTYAFFIDTAGDDSYGGASTNISFGYGFGGFFIDAEGTDQYTGTYTGITDGGAPTENADNCGGISIDFNPTDEKIPAFLAFERAKEAFFAE